MNDDTRHKRRRELIPRIALLAGIALVVITLGMVLVPGSPREPAEPPFSEQARSAALAETLRLRAAGEELARSGPAGAQPAAAGTVSLLTGQAQALQLPADSAPAGSGTVSPTAVALPGSAAALAGELAASAAQRLADAAVADGGMARLLAAVGTAQLLEASNLAAAAGAPAPAAPDPAAPDLSVGADPFGTCPASASPAATSSAGSAAASAGATLAGALGAAVRAEMESVYGYQVARTRLGGDAAAAAAQQLARHEALLNGAEQLSRMHCAPVPARQAGYAVDPGFLASPAAGLGTLEASTLAAYGDLVALSEGRTRQWAISGLVGAARRSAFWGAETGALPGLAADPAAFPPLSESPTPAP